MYLKRDRRSLFQRPHSQRIAPRRETVRKDSAVHVSLSSDSIFKQPGAETPSPIAWRVSNLRAPDNSRMLIHCSSEELRRHANAPNRNLASGVPDAVYRLGAAPKSTRNVGFFALPHSRFANVYMGFQDAPGKGGINRYAALKPYS